MFFDACWRCWLKPLLVFRCFCPKGAETPELSIPGRISSRSIQLRANCQTEAETPELPIPCRISSRSTQLRANCQKEAETLPIPWRISSRRTQLWANWPRSHRRFRRPATRNDRQRSRTSWRRHHQQKKAPSAERSSTNHLKTGSSQVLVKSESTLSQVVTTWLRVD